MSSATITARKRSFRVEPSNGLYERNVDYDYMYCSRGREAAMKPMKVI